VGVPGQDSLGLQSNLANLAPSLAPGATGIAELRALSGGAIQEIWRFDVLTPSGPIPLILRRAPPGHAASNATIDMPTESLLMRHAASIGVPVPPIRHVLSPADQLGAGFIMDFVAGETLGGRIVKDPALAAARLHLARQCGDILARLHTADIPPALHPQTPADLLSQWREAYAACRWPRPVFDAAFAHLARNCPPAPPRPSLVHGDFRNGNLIIGPDGIRAVLDWELAHAGDPLEDLGWLCVNSWRFGRADKIVGGFGDLDDLLGGYEQAGGAPVDRAKLAWWQAFGTLRWGVMCAGMVASFRGADPSVERAVICRRASETEIDLLRLLAA
jgi:aminoglycoside phosphotransferase (APT) family kinase protein